MIKSFKFLGYKRDAPSELSEEKSIYDTLSPTLLKVEDIQTYITAIDEALRDSRNKNLAITGAYGSGKSSILKTYQSLSPNKKFLNISLANFKVDKIEDQDTQPENNEENNLNRLLELSILQQIFYHVKKSEIPDSRFKRINSLSQNNIIRFVLIILIWLVSYTVLFHFPLIEGWFPEIIYSRALKISAATFFLGGIGIGLGNLRRVFNNSKINKFNIQSGDFEIDKDIDRSIINKHLDEIIYFFHVTDYRIVVIEDLDRFNNTEIFSKLREINLLLNNSEQISKSKKPIVFIYAIRDDMFVDRDRVKFFDFIVPIIPIINPSNSSDILLKRLETLKDDRKPSTELVQGISYFIDDMRLLKNIWNEYLTYRDILKESLSQDKLFSIITYKNFYPDDFVALHTNEGHISKIFEKRRLFEQKLFTQLDNEIENFQDELKELERQRIDDENELKKIYIATLFEVYPHSVAFLISGKIYSLHELFKDEYFDKLKSTKSLEVLTIPTLQYDSNYRNYRGNITNRNEVFNFSILEKKVNEKFSFENRMKLVNKDYSYKDQIISKISALQEKKKVIKNYDLRQLLIELDAKEILEDYNSNKLLVYIVTNGYVDKYYSEYISYFHGVSLSSMDHDFLIALRSGVAFDFEFELKNVSNLAAKIESRYFNTRAILNYQLLDFWFSDKKHEVQQQSIISLLSTDFKDKVDFIKGTIEYSNEVDNFSRVSIANWNGFWKHLEESTAYTDDIVEAYFKAIIIRGNLKDIVQQSKNSKLKKYIESKDRFLFLFTEAEHFEKIEEVIDELEIEFERITLVKNDLMDFIYETNRYKINEHNLKTMMDYKDENESLSYFDISNSITLKTLKENIDVQIDEYVQNVLLDENQLTNEPVKGFINLLNHSELSGDLKETIIEKFDKSIPDLDEVEDIKIMDLLIDNNKATPTWQNVLLYFNKYEGILNASLTAFLSIKETYTVLNKSKLRETIPDKSERLKLVKELLLNDDLNLKAYTNLLNPTHFIFPEINIDDISKDKAHWVIQNKYAKGTKNNFHYLKENYPDEHIHLAEVQSPEFLSDIEVYELDDNDILSLLKSKSLSLKERLIVFQKQVDDSLISRTPGMAEVVSQILVDAKVKTSYEILNSLFAATKNIELRVKLLNINFVELSDSETYELLRQMPAPYKNIPINYKRPLLIKNDYTRILAENLKKSNLISSYSEDKKGIRIIAKYSD